MSGIEIQKRPPSERAAWLEGYLYALHEVLGEQQEHAKETYNLWQTKIKQAEILIGMEPT